MIAAILETFLLWLSLESHYCRVSIKQWDAWDAWKRISTPGFADPRLTTYYFALLHIQDTVSYMAQRRSYPTLQSGITIWKYSSMINFRLIPYH